MMYCDRLAEITRGGEKMDCSQLSRFTYCFLNAVYVDDFDVAKVYEVVFSDADFREIGLLRVEQGAMRELCSAVANVDFSFDSGFLKCNPHVARLRITSVVMDGMGVLINENHSIHSLYGLLYEGQKNGFYVVNDDYAESVLSTGNGFDDGDSAGPFCFMTHFRNIRFSQSSMSVYVQMRNKDGCYNRMLVVPDNGIMHMNSFYFLVPADNSFSQNGCKFISQVCIDKRHFSLFCAELLGIYDVDSVLSGALVNKAFCIRQRCYNAQIALKDLSQSIWRSLSGDEDKESLPWVGGSKSYADGYGVTFDSSIKLLKRSDRLELQEYVIQKVIREHMSFAEFKQLTAESRMNILQRYVCMCMAAVFEYASCSESIDLLEAANQMINGQKDSVFICDLFLYRIRLYLYMSGKSIVTDRAHPALFGGNEVDFTVVQEGHYYGIV